MHLRTSRNRNVDAERTTWENTGNVCDVSFILTGKTCRRKTCGCSSPTLAAPSKPSSFSSTYQSCTQPPLPPPHPTNAYCCRRVVLSRDHKMALIQMSTVEEATQALIDLHNYNMGGNQHLRVSFSKSTI